MMPQLDPTEDESDPDALLAIFAMRKKAALEKHCRTAVIYMGDLVTWGLASFRGRTNMQYFRAFSYRYPEHLIPRDGELSGLQNMDVGPWPIGKRPKSISKIMQGFKDQRHLAAHLLVETDHQDRWHFFHFDQRDLAEHDNHWREGGEHVHLMNWLTHPTANPYQLLVDFKAQEKLPHGVLHVRCVP